MSSKTRSGETSREKFRMLRALLPDTPRPHKFQPNKKKTLFTVFVVISGDGRQGVLVVDQLGEFSWKPLM